MNPQPKPIREPKKRRKPLKRRTAIKRSYKSTGERALFLEVWDERDHVCEMCGAGITEFNIINFHHIKPKSTYPELKLDKGNIALICFECHYNEHNR